MDQQIHPAQGTLGEDVEHYDLSFSANGIGDPNACERVMLQRLAQIVPSPLGEQGYEGSRSVLPITNSELENDSARKKRDDKLAAKNKERLDKIIYTIK